MSSKLKPTIDRLAAALAEHGLRPKRAALIEIAAKAFGCRTSNELTAAANASRLDQTECAPTAVLPTHLEIAVVTTRSREFTLSGWTKTDVKRALANWALEQDPSLDEPSATDRDQANQNAIDRYFATGGDYFYDTVSVPEITETGRKAPIPTARQLTNVWIDNKELSIFLDPTSGQPFGVPGGVETASAPNAGLVRLNKRKGEQPIIRPFMDISTVHVSKTTADWLNEQGLIAAECKKDGDPEPVLNIAATIYGWFLWAGTDPTPKLRNTTVPDDLLALMAYARKHKADYILLDADAPEYDELPKYDWSQSTKRVEKSPKPTNDLIELRRYAADLEFQEYDFGDELIESADGWEFTTPGVEMVRNLYLCATDEDQSEPGARTTEGQTTLTAYFKVVFASETSTEITEVYALNYQGEEIGKRGTKRLN